MSSMRIGGIASGLDTEQIISDLMKAESVKVDKLEQDKQILEWKQEAYNNVNLNYANFILNTKKELDLTTTTSTGTLFSNSVSNLDWVKSATSSDKTVAEVSASSSSAEGSYGVTVHKLATNFSAASSANISDGDKTDLATQFNDIAAGDTIEFTIETDEGNKTFQYSGGLDSVTLDDIVIDINDANIGVTAMYDETADRFFIQSDDTGSTNTLKITDNSALTGGVKFMTGANSVLKLQQDEDGDSIYTDFQDATVYSGVDAQIDFGASTNITQSSNTFTLNEINFDLKSTGSITVTVATDVDSIYGKIEGFVNSYNELVDEVYGKLREERDRDYKPLTDEQKESMSEDDIEMWEEKAKSGLLRSNMIIERTMQNVRAGLYETVQGVTGEYDQLTEIGITTEAYTSGSAGKLQIDKMKLREAIQNDADSVLELVFKEPSDALKLKSEDDMTQAELEQKRSESGLINRLYDNIVSGMKDIINKSGIGDNSAIYRDVKSNIMINFITEHGSISLLDGDINDIDDRIDNMYDRLSSIEDRYWSKFTAMEKALNKMNEQGSWLMQQIGGMQ